MRALGLCRNYASLMDGNVASWCVLCLRVCMCMCVCGCGCACVKPESQLCVSHGWQCCQMVRALFVCVCVCMCVCGHGCGCACFRPESQLCVSHGWQRCQLVRALFACVCAWVCMLCLCLCKVGQDRIKFAVHDRKFDEIPAKNAICCLFTITLDIKATLAVLVLACVLLQATARVNHYLAPCFCFCVYTQFFCACLVFFIINLLPPHRLSTITTDVNQDLAQKRKIQQNSELSFQTGIQVRI